MKKTNLIIGLIAASLPFCGLAVDQPNFILILADDMGYGDAGFNGCKDIPTPAMDSIAQNGIRFTQGYVTAPQCAPSRSGLLTGRDQNKIICNNNMVLDVAGLTDGPTFADRMRAAGYRTGMVGKWHLGDHPGKHPMDRGFDEFFGFLGGGSFYYPPGRRDSIANILDGHEPVKVSRYLTDVFGDRAVEFIAENKAKPFFLYLAFNAPHTPMQAPKEVIARFQHLKSKDKNRPTYAAMVSVMDQNIQKVLAALKTQGIEENTIVVFLSDNGGPETKNGSDNGALRGVKGDILEGGVRVPFAIQWPGKVKPGQTVDTPVSSLDLLPTALAAAGKPMPAGLDGKNLLPALLGRDSYPERLMTWLFPLRHDHRSTWWWGVRQGDWKLVYFNPRGQGGLNPELFQTGLFNLKEDVGESKDLSMARPEIRQRLQDCYDMWRAKLPEPFSRLDQQAVAAYMKAKTEAARKRKRAGNR